MSDLVGTDLPSVRRSDVPSAYQAIVDQGWIVDKSGARLLAALQAGYSGATFERFEDIVHFEATVNGRGMMDHDLPASGPERQEQLLERSLAYACLALQAAPEKSAHPILGYVSLSEGGSSDDTLTANVTFCTDRPHILPYVGDIRSYREEALLELTRDEAGQLLSESAFRNHQELDVTVVAVAPVGAKVEVGGTTGFIDQAKHPSWWDETIAPPQLGDKLHVVVLDADREPPRFSALQQDIDIARRLRGA